MYGMPCSHFKVYTYVYIYIHKHITNMYIYRYGCGAFRICTYTYIYMYIYICIYNMYIYKHTIVAFYHGCYGMATISRLLKITGLFCKRALLKRLYSAKEPYDFKKPTNRSHPIRDRGCRASEWCRTYHMQGVRKSHISYVGCQKVAHIVCRVSESRAYCIQSVSKSHILYAGCQKVAHIVCRVSESGAYHM